MEAGSGDAFTELGTIGIEEEFFVVDDRGHPTSGSDELVYESEPPTILEDRIDHELFKFVIETQTPLIEDISEAPSVQRAVREALVSHAADHGFQIAAAGLHPSARWRELEHAEKPRYRSQLDRIQYPQHRNTTAGLHVHVGVDDPDKAVWIANEIRWHLPIVLALSANSPFWNGFDTGLASARATIFENLPNTGMPTEFAGIDDYLAYERIMLESGAIEDRGEIWFEVRPHTEYGTVEVRTADAQADPAIAMAFVEYTHALVLDLAERYADGVRSNPIRRELLDQNKWQALRHGTDATFIDRDGTSVIDLADAVDRDSDRLGITGLRDVLDRENGADRQRRIRVDEGIDALCRDLML